MIANPEEAFKYFVDDSDSHWLTGLLAYAICEQTRIEHEEFNNKQPKEAISTFTHWYPTQPPPTFINYVADAENALNVYAESILNTHKQNLELQILEKKLSIDLDDLNKKTPSFAKSILINIVGAFSFAAIISLIGTIILWNLDWETLIWILEKLRQ